MRRLAPLVALLVISTLLVLLVASTTPWRPVGAVPGGRSPADWKVDFTGAERARERAYHRALRPPVYLGLLAGIAAAAVLGLTPLGAQVVSRAGSLLGEGWVSQVLVGGLAVALLARLATLPFDLQAERVERRYHLSTQTWGSWTLDQLRGLALGAALLVGVLLVGYAVARRSPQGWWIWCGLGAAALTLALSFLYPLVVEPIFNRFTSLPAGPLRSGLLALAQQDRVAVSEVLVSDASRRTTTENAYVSGFGRTRRIVVYDTLLRAPPEEVRLVVAHELAHAKYHDVLRGTLLGALAAAAGACLLFVLVTSTRLLQLSGAPRADDPRSVALVMFLIAVLGLALQPAYNLLSRRVEARADLHSLALTRDPETFVRVERRLALSNLAELDPSLLVYALFATHPSVTERIALARDWARQHRLPPPPPGVERSQAVP